MDVLFLSGLFPVCYRVEIEKKSIDSMQYAADALQWSIVRGLDCYTSKLKLINLPYIGSFPFGYKGLYVKSFSFSHNGRACDENIGFLNIAIYKFVSRYLNAVAAIKKWAMVSQREKVLLVYAFHTPFLMAALKIKKKFPNIKLCLIIPDLPQHMNSKPLKILNFLKKTDIKIQNKCLLEFDAFIVLSKYMINSLNLNEKPWICLEGIFDCSATPNIKKYSSANKIILYSGNLAARYGILNLLNAFKKIGNRNYRLWICGNGDTRESIQKQAKVDDRIRYFGQIPREKVLKLQTEATVLINPRPPKGEYTKYSFPSKIMEYFASGTPTIMYRLEGIPEEYFEHCFLVEENTISALAKIILNVCEMNADKLQEVGNNARSFIINNKNPLYQCGKIYKLLSKLC